MARLALAAYQDEYGHAALDALLGALIAELGGPWDQAFCAIVDVHAQ